MYGNGDVRQLYRKVQVERTFSQLKASPSQRSFLILQVSGTIMFTANAPLLCAPEAHGYQLDQVLVGKNKRNRHRPR